MQREPEIALNSNDNPLPHSPQFADSSALHSRQRRLRGSEKKRAVEPYVLQRLADYTRFESAEIGGDIRQFWHGYQIARRSHTLAMRTLESPATELIPFDYYRFPAFPLKLHRIPIS
jgi:hypothetical protein